MIQLTGLGIVKGPGLNVLGQLFLYGQHEPVKNQWNIEKSMKVPMKIIFKDFSLVFVRFINFSLKRVS